MQRVGRLVVYLFDRKLARRRSDRIGSGERASARDSNERRHRESVYQRPARRALAAARLLTPFPNQFIDDDDDDNLISCAIRPQPRPLERL